MKWEDCLALSLLMKWNCADTSFHSIWRQWHHYNFKKHDMASADLSPLLLVCHDNAKWMWLISQTHSRVKVETRREFKWAKECVSLKSRSTTRIPHQPRLQRETVINSNKIAFNSPSYYHYIVRLSGKSAQLFILLLLLLQRKQRTHKNKMQKSY